MSYCLYQKKIKKGEISPKEARELMDFLKENADDYADYVDEIEDAIDVVEGTSNLVDEAAEALMDGAQYTKQGRIKVLKGDINYKTSGGHLYKTDSLGRIDSVEGTLELATAKRNTYAQSVAGRADRLPDDDGGHLIASIFNGSGDLDNLVPMNSNLNRGAWKQMENTWATALGEGKEVKVLIDTVYEGASQRPSKFIVEYIIDGKKNYKTFNNVTGG